LNSRSGFDTFAADMRRSIFRNARSSAFQSFLAVRILLMRSKASRIRGVEIERLAEELDRLSWSPSLSR
jgi:hypothetical protein